MVGINKLQHKKYTICGRYQQLFFGKEVINFDFNPINNITILFTRILKNIKKEITYLIFVKYCFINAVSNILIQHLD
jgi:hypothetical protein